MHRNWRHQEHPRRNLWSTGSHRESWNTLVGNRWWSVTPTSSFVILPGRDTILAPFSTASAILLEARTKFSDLLAPTESWIRANLNFEPISWSISIHLCKEQRKPEDFVVTCITIYSKTTLTRMESKKAKDLSASWQLALVCTYLLECRHFCSLPNKTKASWGYIINFDKYFITYLWSWSCRFMIPVLASMIVPVSASLLSC